MIAGLLVLLLIGFVVFYLATPQSLYWSAKEVGTDEVDVYLQGPEAPKVSGFDLKIAFDRSNVHVDSAEAGSFFASPITVKFDSNSLSYSLITNPVNKTVSDPTKPVMKFRLTPSPLTGYKFSVLPASQVYVSGSGGAFPKASDLILK